MKKYLKNKNFTPKNYVKSFNNRKSEGSKRGIIYLIIINLFIFPITIEAIFKTEKSEVVEINKSTDEGISIDSIVKWVNKVDKDVELLNVEDNKGIIEVKSIEKVYSLEEEDNIVISSIIEDEKGNYILEVKEE